MNSNHALSILKKAAAILLMCCFFMPLSKCESKADVHGKTVTEESYMYAYVVAKDSSAEIGKGKITEVFTLVATLGTFFLPLVSLGLTAKAQAAVCVAGSFAAQYWLYLMTYLYQGIQIGGALAIGCWVLLFLLGCIDLWRYLRIGKAAQA